MPSDAATRGTLVVHLRSASNLRSADRGGSSDPYVKLKLNAGAPDDFGAADGDDSTRRL